jgi:predicted secreted Zn-dependent protease
MRITLAILTSLATIGPSPATAQALSKSYSYFSIDGITLDEIESELGKRGPQVGTAGRRHPGATRMQFSTNLTYEQGPASCRVKSARVAVKADIILPRWKTRGGALADVVNVWDTLSSDIKRHEESHVLIAKRHARDLQDALKALWPKKSCDQMKLDASATAERILKRHDEEQARFDRIESKNFQARMRRLFRYRMEQREGARPRG